MIKNFQVFKKTRNNIFNAISSITGKKKLDSESIYDFEEKLLLSDIGFDLTSEIVQKISKSIEAGVKIEDFLKPEMAIKRRITPGSTGLDAVEVQKEQIKKRLEIQIAMMSR